jgi:hypothetical protein
MVHEKYIGLDFDGVLCSDIDYPWEDLKLKELAEFRSKLHPIFMPIGPFVIITGRPEYEKEHTQHWLDTYHIKPRNIYFNKKEPSDWTAVAQHKADTIFSLRFNLTIFVESSHKQVEFIRQQVGNIVPIVHFSDFIAQKIYENPPRI